MQVSILPTLGSKRGKKKQVNSTELVKSARQFTSLTLQAKYFDHDITSKERGTMSIWHWE